MVFYICLQNIKIEGIIMIMCGNNGMWLFINFYCRCMYEYQLQLFIDFNFGNVRFLYKMFYENINVIFVVLVNCGLFLKIK